MVVYVLLNQYNLEPFCFHHLNYTSEIIVYILL